MHFRLVDARQIQGCILWLKFSDGVEGDIDLGDELDGPIFEPLKNADLFRQFRIDPDLHTLVWPNGPIFRQSFCMTTFVSPPNAHRSLLAAS
jgi:hypothetical protein